MKKSWSITKYLGYSLLYLFKLKCLSYYNKEREDCTCFGKRKFIKEV